MKEYNPFWSIPHGADTAEMNVDFRNEQGVVSYIADMAIEAGNVTTKQVMGTLNILEGSIQSAGVLDFRGLPQNGVAEVAGHCGGVLVGEGIFNNSLDSRIYPPAGVDVSFKIPTGGSTAAVTGGMSFFKSR